MMAVPRTEDGGYTIAIAPLAEKLPQDKLAAATLINQAVEQAALRWPTQYQWQYNRYKQPAGAPPPPSPQAGGRHVG
jgi:KDO2-lipid IV(A) lauroyltransferase